MAGVFEIRLQSMTLDINESIADIAGYNGLIASLYYSSPSKSSLVTTRTYVRSNNNDLTNHNLEEYSSILFKERIVGSAYLEMELTSLTNAKNLMKLYHNVYDHVCDTKCFQNGNRMMMINSRKKSFDGPFGDYIMAEYDMIIIGRGSAILNAGAVKGEFDIDLKVPQSTFANPNGQIQFGGFRHSSHPLFVGASNGIVKIVVEQIFN